MMDPNYPATKRFIAVAQQFLVKALPTMTPERLDELDRQVEQNSKMRQMMFAGRIRRVEPSEEAGCENG